MVRPRVARRRAANAGTALNTLKAGLIGKHPTLAKLEHGDLMHHTDFRSVYATLLEQWLKPPSSPVLGRDFRELALLRS